MTALSACLIVLLIVIVPARDVPETSLEEIIGHEADYCRKLEAAAMDFVCLEDIEEIVNQSKDIKLDQPGSFDLMKDGVWMRSKAALPPGKLKRALLYDYQFVRESGRIRETRTLIQENREKRHEKNAKLKTMSFVFQNALLGPVAIFGGQWRDAYDYRISGDARVGERPAVIIDVRPKASAPVTRYLYGRAFVDKENFNILKIEWNEARIGNPGVFIKRGERYGMKPWIRLESEFGIEKNGILFPSRLHIEEAYLDKKGRKFTRSETSVIYKDFRFFKVSIEEVKAK